MTLRALHAAAAAVAFAWLLLAAPAPSLAQDAKPGAAAAAQAQPQRHLVVVGQTSLRIPVPAGFVEPSVQFPGFAVVGEQFTPPTNRFLAIFVTPEDLAAAKSGKEPGMQRYFLVQTLRSMEGQQLTTKDFAEARKVIRENYKTLLSKAKPEVQRHLDKAVGNVGEMSGSSLKVEVGQILPLEVFIDEDRAASMLALTGYRTEVNGKPENLQVAMSLTTALVDGKIVYFYAYAKHKDASDLAWTKRAASQWVAGLGATGK